MRTYQGRNEGLLSLFNIVVLSLPLFYGCGRLPNFSLPVVPPLPGQLPSPDGKKDEPKPNPVVTPPKKSGVIAKCPSGSGIGSGWIEIKGNQVMQTFIIDTSTALAVHGNEPTLNLSVQPPANKNVDLLCLVLKGNKGIVNLDVLGNLSSLYITAEGNEHQIHVRVPNGGDLGPTFAVELHGNKNDMSVSGAGKYVCPTVRSTGNEVNVTCQ